MRTTTIAWMVALMGCSTSVTAGTDGGDMDAGVTVGDAGDTDGGPRCAPVTCEIACEHGFARDADGCEICSCAPAPIEACAADADCVLAYVPSCCGCERGRPRAQVDADPCLVARGEPVPPGCLPDPEVCATVDCAACEPLVRAFCVGGTCAASGECEAGDVEFQRTCVPACASHADCALGADYSSCCGGCGAAPRAYIDATECFGERRSDTGCAPPAGACDGLGCPSPAEDCSMFGAAVCMDDGTCREGGAGGACPTGYRDDGGVCVAE